MRIRFRCSNCLAVYNGWLAIPYTKRPPLKCLDCRAKQSGYLTLVLPKDPEEYWSMLRSTCGSYSLLIDQLNDPYSETWKPLRKIHLLTGHARILRIRAEAPRL